MTPEQFIDQAAHALRLSPSPWVPLGHRIWEGEGYLAYASVNGGVLLIPEAPCGREGQS